MSGSPEDSSRGLIERAQQYHFRDSIPPEEFEALIELSSELVNPGVYDTQCFVIGSYDPGEKSRLEHVKQEVNSWPGGTHRAYLMDEFPDGVHPIIEFQLIADYSDTIIGVFEHDEGGFQLELGMFILFDKYREQFSLLKRTYATEEEEHENYNWMLSRGAFSLLDYYDSIQEWQTQDEFENEVDALLTDLLE